MVFTDLYFKIKVIGFIVIISLLILVCLGWVVLTLVDYFINKFKRK